MNKMLNQCPACGGQLIITGCRCQTCNLEMRGDFQPSRLVTLTEDQLAFIQVFLKVRGNLSEAERVLGVSYPTIRNKLEEVNAVLERTIANPAAAETSNPIKSENAEDNTRRRILQQVADGALSAQEAAKLLQDAEDDRL